VEAFPCKAVLPSADCTMLSNTYGLVLPLVVSSVVVSSGSLMSS